MMKNTSMMQLESQIFYIETVQSKHSFFKYFEKMVFPKQSQWNMIFLVLSGKIIFVFPENMIFSFRHKRKIIRKIPGNMIFHSNVLKRWFFQKNSCLNMIFFVIPGKMVFLFFEKICYFFFR